MIVNVDEEAQAPAMYSENAEFWIKIIREGLDPYRRLLTDDAVLGQVRAVPGMRILDAGCGEGYLCRAMARSGASVVGIDACDELIQAAAQAASDEGLAIEHRTALLSAIPLEDASVDVVVCNHVLNDLEDIDEPFREFARVLVPGGRLVILMLHPCFYNGHRARTAAAEGTATPAIPAGEYFGVRSVRQHFVVAGHTSPAEVSMWFRPLETYVSALAGAGFSITALGEPHPTPAMIADDPWWSQSFPRPLFLLMEAQRGRS